MSPDMLLLQYLRLQDNFGRAPDVANDICHCVILFFVVPRPFGNQVLYVLKKKIFHPPSDRLESQEHAEKFLEREKCTDPSKIHLCPPPLSEVKK